MSMIDELRKCGIKVTPCKPRKLSPAEEKRHRQVQKAVRTFLKKMDKISRPTGRSKARFYARSVAHHSSACGCCPQGFQKTKV